MGSSPQALAAGGSGGGGSWGKLCPAWHARSLCGVSPGPCVSQRRSPPAVGRASPTPRPSQAGSSVGAPWIPPGWLSHPRLVLLRSVLLCRWLLHPGIPGPTCWPALSKSTLSSGPARALVLQGADQGSFGGPAGWAKEPAQRRWRGGQGPRLGNGHTASKDQGQATSQVSCPLLPGSRDACLAL